MTEIPPALDALLQSLLNLPKLHTISLNDNAIGLMAQGPVCAFLAEHTPLEHLYLNNNGLGPEAGTLIANALTKLAAKKKQAQAAPLQTVICGRNRLENGSMAAWAKAYEAHTGITHVKMVQNGIRPEGITLLLRDGLKHSKGMKVLDLQDNTFTENGARALADVIGEWTELQELGASDCYLRPRGFIMLVEALQAGKHSALEVLRLQYNDIDSKGIKALADAQQHLPKLRRLELNGNKFSEDDVQVEKLREALDARREKFGPPAEEGEHEDWGLDELDELDDESDEEDEASADEEDEEREDILKQSDQAEEENVAQEPSKDVDQLADLLGKTELK